MRSRWIAALVASFALSVAAQDAPAPDALSPEVEQLIEAASQAEATEILSEEAKLSERVRAILDAVEAYRGMRAEVEAGIAVLSGTAASREVALQAAATVQKLGGVLMVVDDVEIERALERRFRDSWHQVVDQLRGLLAALPLLVAALGIALAFYLLARVLREVGFLYRMASDRALLEQLLRQTVFYAGK